MYKLLAKHNTAVTNSQIRVNFVTTFTNMSDLKALNDIYAVHLTAMLCLEVVCTFVYKSIYIKPNA